MASAFSSFNSSPLGAFVQSPLLARDASSAPPPPKSVRYYFGISINTHPGGSGTAVQCQLWHTRNKPYNGATPGGFPVFVNGTNQLGQSGPSAGFYERWRICLDMPCVFPTATAMTINMVTTYVMGGSNLNPGWWASATNDYSAGVSRGYNTNVFLGYSPNVPNNPSGTNVSINATSMAPYLAAAAGSHNLSLVIADVNEASNAFVPALGTVDFFTAPGNGYVDVFYT